ncbi:spore germination protein [Melghirimyces algeriensis]|uniref:Spore germination protein gerPA/gerPF n=1 Tax=Melghirimyces algeriensis TaxID=910412 RepID=A0A521AK72_9BACL|nr:spore germination protein [Melghirimyces algeriensis]SMO35244.1 Spore germination protein gerPA/gerPF [Melghirimyces algeriensis]
MINHIFNTKVQDISNTALFNLGDAVNLYQNENTQSLGGSGPIGDFSINIDGGQNQSIDPDILDQV